MPSSYIQRSRAWLLLELCTLSTLEYQNFTKSQNKNLYIYDIYISIFEKEIRQELGALTISQTTIRQVNFLLAKGDKKILNGEII